jgi:hypothetical protein
MFGTRKISENSCDMFNIKRKWGIFFLYNSDFCQYIYICKCMLMIVLSSGILSSKFFIFFCHFFAVLKLTMSDKICALILIKKYIYQHFH